MTVCWALRCQGVAFEHAWQSPRPLPLQAGEEPEEEGQHLWRDQHADHQGAVSGVLCDDTGCLLFEMSRA